MALNVTSKNQMLDAFTADKVSLHYASPGTDGTTAELAGTGYARQNLTWGTASNGQRSNTAAVVFNIQGGAGNNSKVKFVSLWAGTTFKGSQEVTEETFGADGTYTLPATTGVVLKLSDPA